MTAKIVLQSLGFLSNTRGFQTGFYIPFLWFYGLWFLCWFYIPLNSERLAKLY